MYFALPSYSWMNRLFCRYCIFIGGISPSEENKIRRISNVVTVFCLYCKGTLFTNFIAQYCWTSCNHPRERALNKDDIGYKFSLSLFYAYDHQMYAWEPIWFWPLEQKRESAVDTQIFHACAHARSPTSLARKRVTADWAPGLWRRTSTQYRLMYAASLAPHPSAHAKMHDDRSLTVNNNVCNGYFNLAKRNWLFLQQDCKFSNIWNDDYWRPFTKTLVDLQDPAQNPHNLKNNHCTISHSSNDAPHPCPISA